MGAQLGEASSAAGKHERSIRAGESGDEETGRLISEVPEQSELISEVPAQSEQNGAKDEKEWELPPTTILSSDNDIIKRSPREASRDCERRPALKCLEALRVALKYTAQRCFAPRTCLCLFVTLLLGWMCLGVFHINASKSIKAVIEDIGSQVTGVPVHVGSVNVDLLRAQAKLTNVTIFNPPSCPSAPYFLSCESVTVGMSWQDLLKVWSKLFVIQQLSVVGLQIYIDDEVLLTNYDIIMQHIESSPLYKFADKQDRFIIEKFDVDSVRIHTVFAHASVLNAEIPYLEVGHIGARQHGVGMGKLLGLVVNAFAFNALQFSPRKPVSKASA